MLIVTGVKPRSFKFSILVVYDPVTENCCPLKGQRIKAPSQNALKPKKRIIPQTSGLKWTCSTRVIVLLMVYILRTIGALPLSSPSLLPPLHSLSPPPVFPLPFLLSLPVPLKYSADLPSTTSKRFWCTFGLKSAHLLSVDSFYCFNKWHKIPVAWGHRPHNFLAVAVGTIAPIALMQSAPICCRRRNCTGDGKERAEAQSETCPAMAWLSIPL